jgi:hypothetical protein
MESKDVDLYTFGNLSDDSSSIFSSKQTSVIMHVVRVVWHCLLLSVGLIFLLVLGLALV